MKRTYLEFFQDILQHIDYAIEFTEQTELSAFQGDQMRVLAVTRAVEVIGEAARKLPLKFKKNMSSYRGKR